jgi:hypothetical protein
MADTWFRGRVRSTYRYGLSKKFDDFYPGLVDCTHTDSTGARYLWLNLSKSKDNEYVGWVNINLHTGEIEFGEPAA